MTGNGNTRPLGRDRRGAPDSAQARRKLLKSRFSVFDGGGGAGLPNDSHEAADGEHLYHPECYACPVGRAFRGISEAARSDAVEGALDALADLIRAGTRLLDTIAARAGGASGPDRTAGIERVNVE